MNLIDYLILAIDYVTSDPFFLPSMALTAVVGLFIGSVIYDGVLRDVKKATITIFCYAMLVSFADSSRVIPRINPEAVYSMQSHYLAGTAVVIFVTIFYILGMIGGVWVTKLARREARKNR